MREGGRGWEGVGESGRMCERVEESERGERGCEGVEEGWKRV